MTNEVTPTQQAETALLLEESINDRIFKALESDTYRTQQLFLNFLQQAAYDYRSREALRNALGAHEHTFMPSSYTSSTSTTNWK